MIQMVFTVAEAAKLTRMSKTALYQMITSGELVAKKRGRRTLILAEDLASWLKSLPEFKNADAA